MFKKLKMKNLIYLIVCMAIAVHVRAQKADSTTSVKVLNNELGVIANPVGIILLGAEPIGKRVGISFKRNCFKSDTYITSGAYYQGYRNYNDKYKEQTLEIDGWLRKIQLNLESSHTGVMALGIEKRRTWNSCPKIIAYYGTEAQFNYGKTNQNIGFQWQEADSTSKIENNPYQFRPVSEFIPTKNITKTIIGGGFQVNLGLQLHLNKRIYLFAQTAPSFILAATTRVDNDILNNEKNEFKYSTFNFDMRAVIGDIGLFLRL